ncbi:hypothetical protein GQ55_7G186100 [Panicum hallii var. hallii]|uniref:Uncharacterized protein n=1 Tax=Panicum hallii var. hallii TaxID=1504633 RepID=A0A2T7CWG1_9POAL|nr:hypothetical protein GQ55_7G186100 [Panicum hallii var. hallii]
MHKDKKIILLPLTPAEIVKHDKKFAEIFKNDHTLDTHVATSPEIKLGGALLAQISLMLKIMLLQHHIIPCFANIFHFHMILLLCLANCVLLLPTLPGV